MSEDGGALQLQKIPTGVSGLDAVLRGGLFQTGITIVQGRPGAGKTILGNQMCYAHARAGGRALFVTLLAENHARMLLHLHTMEFFDTARIPDEVYYISAYPVLEAEGLGGLLTLLWAEVRARNVSLLVLDGLMSVELQAKNHIEFKKFIHELQTQASVSGCSMVLLTSADGEVMPATVEHTMVDCVIEMRSRLYGWRMERDLEVLKRRGDAFLGGRHAFRITSAGIQVYPRFEALLTSSLDDMPLDRKRVPSGLPELDAMFGGGVPAGSITTVTGPSGAGKTTLGMHFLSQCSQREPGVMFSTSESPAAVLSKAGALGLPLAELIRDDHVGLIWSFDTAGMLDEICATLLAEIDRRGARRLLIDGVAGLVKLALDPDRVAHIFAALGHGMRARGVTTLFTAEHYESGLPPTGMPDLPGISENIVAMRLLERRSALVRLIQVRKARDAQIDARLRTFEIERNGLRVAPSHDAAEAILAGEPWTQSVGF